MYLRNYGLALLTLMTLNAVSIRPAAAQVVNGGFETGNLAGWTHSGFINAFGGPVQPTTPSYSAFLAAQAAGTPAMDSNGAESSQTISFTPSDPNAPLSSPPANPTQGSFLGFISNETSVGDDTLTGSSISQTFTVPVKLNLLQFDVQFLSNENGQLAHDFNDFGGLALTQGNTIVAEYNLDLDPSSGANAHVTFGAIAGGFADSTGWLRGSFDLASLAGQNVKLTAYTLQYGSNAVESRLLLDNIQSVPEPGTVGLLVGFTTPGAIWLLRRRKRKAA